MIFNNLNISNILILIDIQYGAIPEKNIPKHGSLFPDWDNIFGYSYGQHPKSVKNWSAFWGMSLKKYVPSSAKMTLKSGKGVFEAQAVPPPSCQTNLSSLFGPFFNKSIFAAFFVHLFLNPMQLLSFYLFIYLFIFLTMTTYIIESAFTGTTGGVYALWETLRYLDEDKVPEAKYKIRIEKKISLALRKWICFWCSTYWNDYDYCTTQRPLLILDVSIVLSIAGVFWFYQI